MHGESKPAQVGALVGEIARVCSGRARSHLVVDVACGRSYLLEPLARALPDVRYVGVDRDARLIAGCRREAARLGARAEYIAGRIADIPLPERPDVLVALHACGPATDEAIERAIALHARHALFVPCCHRRPARDALDGLGFPRHSVLRGRLHDTLTDARRTLRLEAGGFEVVAVEFVPCHVTPHNLLLRARWIGRTGRAERARRSLDRLSRLPA